MNCPNCQLLEMRVNRVIDNEIQYVCKNCGKEIIKSVEELEIENSKEG